MGIKIFTSKNCPPCEELEEKLEESGLKDEVELIDIETDEGFLKFKEEVIDHRDGAVPSAFKDGKQCKIGYDEDDKLVLDCPTDETDETEDAIIDTQTEDVKDDLPASEPDL